MNKPLAITAVAVCIALLGASYVATLDQPESVEIVKKKGGKKKPKIKRGYLANDRSDGLTQFFVQK